MRRRRLLWHLYPYYVLVIVVSLLAASWYASRSVRQFYINRTKQNLEAQARLIAKQFSGHFPVSDVSTVNRLCIELGTLSKARITVILSSGMVVCDSEEDPEKMENHADRPEIISALAGLTGRSIRYSDTMKEQFLYIAVPIELEGEVLGVTRASLPLTFIEESLKGMYVKISLGGVVAAVLAVLVSFIVSRRISRPIEDIKKGAERFANNDLGYRLPVHDLEEISCLAEVMNDMAGRLEDRIETVTRQRNEQEAVFSSMIEGLLVVDKKEIVIRLNRAASDFLGIDLQSSYGKTIQEAVRSPDLQNFVEEALSAGRPVEGEINLHDRNGELFLQVHGTRLFGSGGNMLGAVIVLNDVTRLRRLENLRRDFVANVSHELKTPITSIKGFVETLLEGAIHAPKDAEHFLGIIAKHADRMNSIIEDLLLLSRVEQDVEKERVRLEENPLNAVLQEAIQVCDRKADDKDVSVELRCHEDVKAKISPPLIEQAVINLVDNAIKYSDPGSLVTVEVESGENEVVISVRDRGCGIEGKHLPRLFERFYRVEKARSRKLGGTGLGLAIVKHIAMTHNGTVKVESTPGVGSVFSIHMPITP
ncbi:MAG: PAS domain-containing protein [Candidatus Krumholzibacteria bacterium]|nr:PAS domain-containing protein [Candidatus Krumholzibacteria bacterium]